MTDRARPRINRDLLASRFSGVAARILSPDAIEQREKVRRASRNGPNIRIEATDGYLPPERYELPGILGSGVATPTYTVTNATTDRAFDAPTATVAELANVLGTLIADLKAGRTVT